MRPTLKGSANKILLSSLLELAKVIGGGHGQDMHPGFFHNKAELSNSAMIMYILICLRKEIYDIPID